MTHDDVTFFSKEEMKIQAKFYHRDLRLKDVVAPDPTDSWPENH